jgi:predicted esterase
MHIGNTFLPISLFLYFVIAQSLPRVWEALGPFPHGTREVGYDPLSSFGGFESLPFSTSDQYPSELADGGYVGWKRIESSQDGSVTIQYDEIRWEFNLRSLGWTALQHGTFLRGQFDVDKSGVYLVSFKGLITYKIDDKAFPGDVYAFDHASESSIYLERGKHTLYAYLVLDVRIHGGSTPPKNSFSGSIRYVDMSKNSGIVGYPDDTILPEMMDGVLVSPMASVSIKNSYIPEFFESQGKMTDGPGWKQILRIQIRDEKSQEIPAKIATLYTIMLAPGQTAAIPFRFLKQVVPKKVTIDVILLDLDTESLVGVPIGTFEFVERKWGDVYKFTMEGYDTAIQYAYVKPPRISCLAFTNRKCPVIVALHGAGVKVSEPAWLDAIAQQDHAWVLSPSGRTPWGFDWHGPSFRNIDASVEALDNMWGVPLSEAANLVPDSDRLIIMGHSNGGQGCWWYTSHYPDRVLAAVPASGFLKIQMYVPYYLHVGFAHADPMIRGFMESSISENDLDLYASNMGGIPILARTGALDTNVPPIHTRRMLRLIDEWSGHTNSIKYVCT